MAALAAAAVLAGVAPGGVAACIGVPGSGKTTVAQEALQLASWGKQCAVFDPYAVRDRLNWRNGHRERAPWWPDARMVTVDELLRDVVKAGRAGRPSLLDGRHRLVVAGSRGTLEPVQLGRDFGQLVHLLWLTHGWALIAEECGIYSRMAAEAVNRVATGGAHAGMRLVLLCQRLGRIQKDAREGITTLVAGAQGAPEDIADIRERCGTRFAEAVRAIPPPELLDNGRTRPGGPPIAWRLGDGLREA